VTSAAEAEDERPSTPSTTGNRGAFTSESAREARKLRGTGLQRQDSDSAIEASLRKAARTDPRAAETLIRWLARPKDVVLDDSMEGLSTEELERIHAGLMRLCSMPSEDMAHVLEAILSGAIDASIG